ncbi:MAG TPA: thiamine-phosphate kinase [Pyrinomonadaceae bacterium]|nr:thiamine-phosphate kinase [Pyrinomonadaceae bacterium]
MNEFDFIKKIRAQADLRGTSSGLVRGIGDDAAVLRSAAGSDVVISTDLLVEGIDFRRNTTQPNQLGHKALAVSLSDIAAMGARPRWSLLSIGVPGDVWETEFIESFYAGFFQLADRFGVKLIGGDLSRTLERIVVNSIVLGECAYEQEVFRSEAKPGDQIYVTGFLGDAAAGLRLIERGARVQGESLTAADNNSIDHLLLRHLQPEPRVGWGLLVGHQQLATAMIDLSDGLSSDLNHLCDESKVGALVDSSSVPIDQLVTEICGRRALDPLMLALHGGEDFELLFTVDPENVSKLPKRVDGIPITRIGEIKELSHGVQIAEGSKIWKLEPGGWEHFKSEGKS